MVVTLQDLTPLEDLERLRAEFLGMVSHELRTPLTSIKGSADTLLENGVGAGPGRDDPVLPDHPRPVREHAPPDRRSARRGPDRDGHPAGIPRTRGCYRRWWTRPGAGSRAGAAGANLVIDLPARTCPGWLADRRRAVQVLNNLLSNAARHSHELSPIRVAAVRGRRPRGPSRSPTTAWGCPPSSCPTCSASSRGWTGRSGDGRPAGRAWAWPSCKGIVEAHGGRIRAESGGPGLGSRFTFTLPAVDEPAQARRQAAPAEAAKGTGAGPHPLRGRRPPDPPGTCGTP